MQHWLLVRGRGDRPLPARGFTLDRALLDPAPDGPGGRSRRLLRKRVEVGVLPSSLWRHSYIRLSPEQFELASAAIGARAV